MQLPNIHLKFGKVRRYFVALPATELALQLALVQLAELDTQILFPLNAHLAADCLFKNLMEAAQAIIRLHQAHPSLRERLLADADLKRLSKANQLRRRESPTLMIAFTESRLGLTRPA